MSDDHVPQFSAADVRRLLSVPESITAAQKALVSLSDGSGLMPVRSVLKLPIEPKVGFLVNMPSFLGGYCATKTITVFPANAQEHQQPSAKPSLSAHQGSIQLFSAEDGHPLCIANAHEVTLLRTAAASAVATQALARDPEGGSVLALLGTGSQCLAHFNSISQVRKIKKVLVWGRNPERAARSSNEIRHVCSNIIVDVKETVEEAVAQADIVCTLTGAREPILQGAWLRPGTHINAVGACTPAHRELDTEVVKRSKVYCDTLAACLSEPGDFVSPLKNGEIEASHLLGEIGNVLSGKLPGRPPGAEGQETITLFKSVGIALEDLTATLAVFRGSHKSKNLEEGEIRKPLKKETGGVAKRILTAPTAHTIRQAQRNIKSKSIVSPLVRLPPSVCPENLEIYLKLESLQPIASFKCRPAANAIAEADPDAVRSAGVCTASAGNFGQGLAWCCKELGVKCTVVAPSAAPKSKLDAMRRLGATIFQVSYEEWWRVMEQHDGDAFAPAGAIFIHPGAEDAVLAGNATIAAEIYDQLPDVDTIAAPWGSGALAVGITCGVEAIWGDHPKPIVVACEPETAAPFSLSMKEKRAMPFEAFQESFVDGCGGKSVLPEIWDFVQTLPPGSLESVSVPLDAIADAVRDLCISGKVVAEGAGATPVAAARLGLCGQRAKKIVCIVSGGGLDSDVLSDVLARVPGTELKGRQTKRDTQA